MKKDVGVIVGRFQVDELHKGHCHMGHCRSGAVCEIGVMMGLKDRETYRNPNMLVKKQLMKVLGWSYD